MAEKTLGGDRLGSGSQMKQEVHNYGMNSFNQGRDFKSTMAPGILYPCFKEIGTNFGTFDIDIDTFVRTLPTKGPLFGSFKMQVDVFNVPFRLYQGILHNNPVDIGLNMNQVYLPVIELSTKDGKTVQRVIGSNENNEQINESSLEKYLGLSGLGHHADWKTQDAIIRRRFQCVPELGYYDIFKNYYSNKQEENAYVITPGNIQDNNTRAKVVTFRDAEGNGWYERLNDEDDQTTNIEVLKGKNDITVAYTTYITELTEEIKNTILENQQVEVTQEEGQDPITITAKEFIEFSISQGSTYTINWKLNTPPDDAEDPRLNTIQMDIIAEIVPEENMPFSVISNNINLGYITSTIQLTPFALKNIDKMRAKLLANNELGTKVLIKNAVDSTSVWGTNSGADGTGLPYSTLVKTTTESDITYNAFEQNGLVVKTYQSDLFNNWLDNSLVETIANRTKIDTTSGGFTPDTLILQEKIYKLLNRIIVGGGTYYDWQEATYGEGVARMCEIPMYIGGMSTEIMFEEVVNNSASEADGRYQALGSLGGKGTIPTDEYGKPRIKGGRNIHVRMDEPGYIMAICSITPRIAQSQGNDWDRTEIESMDDLHKPELDGIGFQDLMAEQMCWWNTQLSTDGTGTVLHRDAVGKQTAWINYQTAVDKIYGDFAKQDGYSFMVLGRNYEHDGIFGIKDMTTYIDPAKFNYAFAYQDLAAQNFWVQISFKCTSRRKMGAQQLPTL